MHFFKKPLTDVFTPGQTAHECAKVLCKAGGETDRGVYIGKGDVAP